MPTLFHLVRHGSYALLEQALGGRADHALSPEGRDEAERIANWFADRRPDTVVSSPMRRAVQTADFIAGRCSLAVQTDAAFAEIDFGDWTGRRFDDLHDNTGWQAWNRFRSTVRVPAGEAILAVQSRAVAGLLRHAAEHDTAAEVVVVSHGDVIKVVLAHFMGSPLDLMRRIEIGPGSISQLMLYAEDAKILAINIRP